MDHRLNRRESLAAAGAAGLGLALGLRPFAGSSTLEAAGACVLQREVTEGPYHLDLDLVRRDIRGGRKGTPLTLRIQVVDATTCRAIPGAVVEIWHADAAGAYSGVQGDSGTGCAAASARTRAAACASRRSSPAGTAAARRTST
jgi:hypothetical protein